nr:hypothetical protein [Chitinophagaceae bacterium]
AIPGIGPKGYERFKKKGIKNIDDLSNRNWLELKDENGFIIPVSQRAKAKKWLEKYLKGK